ncbi:unnamed protein product [Fraxinus pennsylvanica]|uniref:Transmembrane protein n=1 Tax=Fraxinus pennsylvanica TaxID=56036 RepID=A0AAD2AFV3_9LAMI|nr:unnamed protein product [Fraxinus pennsylvanica]
MEFHPYFGFLITLQETVKLLPRNGKLLFSVTIISLLLSSIFFLIFNFSSFSLMRDMLPKESLFPMTSSNSAEFATKLMGIKENFPLVLATYIAFVLSYLIISFFSTINTVSVSAMSYNFKTLTLKELTSKFVKSCPRMFITGFYTTILVAGFTFFAISLGTPLLMSSDLDILGSAILLGILAYIFYLYISVAWIMAIVVTVHEEEICGIQALGKSAEIVKGNRLNGFILNIFLNLLSLGIYLGSKMIQGQTFSGLFLVIFSCLVKILTFVIYTVFYFQCKNENGEEIELHGSTVYSKISTTHLVNDIP